MAYFNRDHNRSGGKRFGKRDFNNGSRFGEGKKPFMHQAICAECGKNCEVPFKPVPGRAVFCSDCFGKRGNGGSRSESHFRVSERNFENRSFEKNNENTGNKDFGQLKEQFELLNSKLDRILSALTSETASQSATVENTEIHKGDKNSKKSKTLASKTKTLDKAKKKVKSKK